jgi:hypothetical protein
MTDGSEKQATVISPSNMSKANTVLQMSALSLAVLYLGGVAAEPGLLRDSMRAGIEGMGVVSAFTCTASAWGYVDGKSMKQN